MWFLLFKKGSNCLYLIIRLLFRGFFLLVLSFVSENGCLNQFFSLSRADPILSLNIEAALQGCSSGFFPAPVNYQRLLSTVSLITFAKMLCSLVSRKKMSSNL